jgi:hypothetical protein
MVTEEVGNVAKRPGEYALYDAACGPRDTQILYTRQTL